MFFVLGHRKEEPGIWQFMSRKTFSTLEEAEELAAKIRFKFPKTWNVIIVNKIEGEQV